MAFCTPESGIRRFPPLNPPAQSGAGLSCQSKDFNSFKWHQSVIKATVKWPASHLPTWAGGGSWWPSLIQSVMQVPAYILLWNYLLTRHFSVCYFLIFKLVTETFEQHVVESVRLDQHAVLVMSRLSAPIRIQSSFMETCVDGAAKDDRAPALCLELCLFMSWIFS